MKNKKKKILSTVSFIVSVVLFLGFIMPFLIVVLNSFKSRIDVVKNPLKFPESISFENYKNAIETMKFGLAVRNSFIVTLLSISLILVFSSMLAYFLVRYKWKMNKIIFMFLVVSMIIPFQAIMIPFVTVYGKIGLLDNKYSLSFFYLGFGLSLATFMYHGFIKGISQEIEESAAIDGASRFKTFWVIVFPILKPITTTIAILDVLWIWNDFLLPSLVLMTDEQRTLPLSTYHFYGTYTTEYSMAMAVLVLSVLPVLVFYLFMQKQIVKGVMEGAIK